VAPRRRARRSDVIALGKQHLTRDGRLQYKQFKGRNKRPVHIDIPVIPELQRIVDASPCGELTFLVTEFRKPFTSNGFGNWFKKRCREAELPHCSAHGVRKAAAAKLAELGCSDHQIMAIGGWQTLKEVQRYTKGARKRVLSDNAMDRVQADIDGTEVSNLSSDER
jgi:integrase